MSLLVMVLVGCCVLVLGFMMLWLTPATTSQPRVGQADRFKCPEPRGKLFRRPAEISHGPSRYDRFTREMR